MSSFLFTFILFTGSIFISMNHPLAMGLILLFQTCLIAIFTGSLSSTFWFSYILFLVFLGGMLVLFIYMTSLASNEMFSLSSPIILFLFPLSLFSGVYALSNLIFDYLNPRESFFVTFSKNILMTNPSDLFMKLYNSFSSHLTILLAAYLFLTLIAVVNLTSINKGPLRPNF